MIILGYEITIRKLDGIYTKVMSGTMSRRQINKIRDSIENLATVYSNETNHGVVCKIYRIKAARKLYGFTLADAKRFVEYLWGWEN